LSNGEHESDYFIEVLGINKAGLQTVKYHKVWLNHVTYASIIY